MGEQSGNRAPGTDRVLFVGFDGIEPDLVREWADAGHMPTFEAMLERSARIPLDPPWGLGSGAMWPSIVTSLNPGSNGTFFFRHLVPGTYRTKPIDDSHISGMPFWEAVSRSGRRTIVVDVPKMRPSRGLNGLMICDWLGHGEIYDQPVSEPPELIEDVIRRFGANPTGPCDITGRTPEEYEPFVTAMQRRIRMKTALTLDLMTGEQWDLMASSFTESHCIGHHCWHLHDPDFVDYDAATAARLGDPILTIYRALDHALSEILAAAPEDAVVMLLLGPGMGPNYNGERALDEILRRLDGCPLPAARKNLALAKTAWRILPVGMRRRFSRVAENVDERSQEIDRAKRRFFMIPGNHSHAAIRINVTGRDPEGRVAPGAEYDAVCGELVAALGELVNAETGKPVFTEFRRAIDEFHGPRLDILPDLMAQWDRTTPATRVASERVGEVAGEFREFRSGDHTMNCELLARTPGLPAYVSNRRHPTEDVGATIAGLLGADYPGAEGRPIERLVAAR
ncbi:MAG: hypothetical protein GY791_14960 [Alphaproteobacteria bacterium]|nr:hypothetical protein [Alphaproteobacteria bacterium]